MVEYIVRYFFERKGKLTHGSKDAETTDCGLRIDQNWEILNNRAVTIHEVNCPRCRKVYEREIAAENAPKYYELLPRRSENHEMCQVLDDDGRLCGRLAVLEVQAHLDYEIYDYSVRWIAFHVCQKHFNVHADIFGKHLKDEGK